MEGSEGFNIFGDPDDLREALLAIEKDKIRGAVRTDFILSAEIIVITLGTVANSTFVTQVLVLTAIAVSMTVGVYGLVAAIVKLDDIGMHLSQRSGETAFARMQRGVGNAILTGAPWLMKGLSVPAPRPCSLSAEAYSSTAFRRCTIPSSGSPTACRTCPQSATRSGR